MPLNEHPDDTKKSSPRREKSKLAKQDAEALARFLHKMYTKSKDKSVEGGAHRRKDTNA